MFASGPGRWRGVEISLGVLESSLFVLEEEGLEVGVSSPEAFLGGGTGRRLICVVKIGGCGSRGPFRGFRFGFFYNGGAERAEEDLIGTTVFAEKRTTFKVSRRLECRGPPTVCHSV